MKHLLLTLALALTLTACSGSSIDRGATATAEITAYQTSAARDLATRIVQRDAGNTVTAATAQPLATASAGTSIAVLATFRAEYTPIVPDAKLALLAGSCTHSNTYSTCEGSVKNIGGEVLRNVEVVIEWTTGEDGVTQSSDDALISYDPLLIDQESPWEVISRYNPALTHFRVKFKELGGGTIKTRDDR